jgi:hypothetical protein
MQALGTTMKAQYEALSAMDHDLARMQELAKAHTDVMPVPLTGYPWEARQIKPR